MRNRASAPNLGFPDVSGVWIATWKDTEAWAQSYAGIPLALKAIGTAHQNFRIFVPMSC